MAKFCRDWWKVLKTTLVTFAPSRDPRRVKYPAGRKVKFDHNLARVHLKFSPLKRRVHWANYVFIIDPYESYLNTVDPGSILTPPWQIFKLKHYCSILANSPGTTSVAFRHLMSSFHAYPREEAARQRAAPHSFATLLCALSPTPDLQPLNWMILFFNLLGFARLASQALASQKAPASKHIKHFYY